MGLLFRDRFNRVASSLGADWNERAGQTVGVQTIGNCNMSCNGDFAQIDAQPVVMIATANASNGSSDHYFSCWCFVGAGNGSSLVFRFQDAGNRYVIFPNNTNARVEVQKIKAGAATVALVNSPNNVLNNGGQWNFISVIVTGSRIRIWVNGRYDTAAGREGPVIDFTDGTPITGTGSCGIMTNGNNATGNNGPQWNDFRLNDNARGQTIYIQSAGTAGYGDGESDAPLPGIMHGLNSSGCIAGSKLKFTDVGPYTNSAITLRHEIGHAGKFVAPAFVFPTYSDDTGEVLDPGTPNLVIEGADGASRTVCRETQGTVPFWSLRDGANGVVFRGLNFEAVSILRAVYQQSTAAGNDHSYSIDKCLITVGPNGGATPFAVSAASTAIRATLSYAAVPINLDTEIFSFGTGAAVRASRFRMFLVVGDCNHAVNYTQLMPTWQSGDVHDCDHITFKVPDKASRTRAGVAILQPNLIAAGSRLTVQNTITVIDGPEQATSSGYGIYVGNTNPPAGTMEEHHNGFDGVALDDCVGPAGNASTNHANTVCNIAAANAALDPGFNNPSGTFTWLHTAGAGVNGEGTFAALTVPDLRVNNLGEYKDAADDATALQILDKGALQDYATPAPPGSAIAGSAAPAAPPPDLFCPTFIYDPGGENEFDFSGRIQIARPIRQERDILLRTYHASDVDLDFIDTDELFVETNPLSPFRDLVTGEGNWYGKRVLIQLAIGATELLRFFGTCLNIKATSRGGSMNVGDRFQELFDRQLLARTVGRIVSTTGALGLGPALPGGANAPATGWYLGNVTLLNQTPATRNRATQCQTWTLTWTADAIPDGTTLAPFFITGSVTGFDGEGQYGVPGSYVSKSGQISIDTSRGGDIREDSRALTPAERTAAKNTTTSIRTVWRPPMGTTAVQALELLLTDWRGAGLAADQIDPSIAALSGTVADQLLPAAEFLPAVCRLAFGENDSLLAAIQQMALHLGCTFIEKANGDIGVASFMPRVVEDPDVLCYSDDLIDLEIDHLPIYNLYSVEHAFSESNDKYTQGFSSPNPEDNDSFARWGRLLPAPGSLQFKGYDASNAPWIEAIARSLYLRYRDPRRIYSIRAKVQRLAADMGDVYRIDSLVPTVGPLFTEPVTISRNITGDLEATLELIEVDSEVVSAGCGGYLALDDPLIGLDDDCWGLL